MATENKVRTMKINNIQKEALLQIRRICIGRTPTSLSQAEIFVIRILAASCANMLGMYPFRHLNETEEEALRNICAEEVGFSDTKFGSKSLLESTIILSGVESRGDLTKLEKLTFRERQVLVSISFGRSNKETASILEIGVRTVETYRQRIMEKLDIHTIAGLTRFAVRAGLNNLTEKPTEQMSNLQ